MVFTDGVHPPDPALFGYDLYNHYHLNYEDHSITYGFPNGKFAPVRGLVPVSSPENENRTLSPHDLNTVIQLVYDPENKGEHRPFNLISLVVYKGSLNVGTRSVTGAISIYNNLTAGFQWNLIDANNLTRATLECCPTGPAVSEVDNIVFEPASSTTALGSVRPLISTAINTGGDAITDGNATPIELDAVATKNGEFAALELLEVTAPVFDALHVEKSEVKLRGPALDQFLVRGRLQLGAQSNSLDVMSKTVILTFGSYREQIPAGLFSCADNSVCDFTGDSG